MPPPRSFHEIKTICERFSEPAQTQAVNAFGQQKGKSKLGRLEEIIDWLTRWQKAGPRCAQTKIAIFAANHGISNHKEKTQARIRAALEGRSVINQLCSFVDAALKLYEMAPEQPTADISENAAMSEGDCANAIAYGMMAVEDGIDILCLGDMAEDNNLSAAALCLALLGGREEDWIEGKEKQNLIKKAVSRQKSPEQKKNHEQKRNWEQNQDPWQVLTALGGLETSAIIGAIIAARIAQIPVILDGFACCTAAMVLAKSFPNALDHCLIAHLSKDRGHKVLCEKLGKKPLMSLDIDLGDATGTALALTIVKTAVDTHNALA